MSNQTETGAAGENDPRSKNGKARIGKAGIFDPKTETFDFPSPNDPDYYVSLEILRGHVGLLLEVCMWREKGISYRQIVTLLEEAAAALT